jgi:hypothetical protein
VTSPDFYTPRPPSATDTLAYTRRVVESILRNNPLTDAVVSRGLIKWIGNYVGGDGSPVNFLWIGEFLPADPNLGGVPQRGFSLVRDDSRGGVSAFVMVDPDPGAGGGLRQIIVMTSGDGKELYRESRMGGLFFPSDNIVLSVYGDEFAKWPSVSTSSFNSFGYARANVIGNTIKYRIAVGTASTAVSSGEVRLNVNSDGVDLYGPTHVFNGAVGQDIFEGEVDVTQFRSNNVEVVLQGRRTSGTGKIYATTYEMRCCTLTP